MRLFTVSDVHVDYAKNLRWVKQLSDVDFKNDLLILAGDLSDKFELALETLNLFKDKFKAIAFLPGNHDIWIRDKDFKSSFEKHNALIKAANEIGVYTSTFNFNEIQIKPIYSWYDYSFGKPSEALQQQWADFYRCEWLDTTHQTQIAEYFFELNTASEENSNQKVITFSHFVPRMDVFPNHPIPIIEKLAPCLGSQKIETLIRQYQSDLHIFGHSHLNRDETINGVRYINNAFGYPKESRISRKKLMEICL